MHGDRSQDDDKRLWLGDDLKSSSTHTVSPSEQSSSQKSKNRMPSSHVKSKKNKSASTRLKTKHSMLDYDHGIFGAFPSYEAKHRNNDAKPESSGEQQHESVATWDSSVYWILNFEEYQEVM
ncbi:hypothetical protein Tco_0686465 [Tanacetum coccineum]